jgi:hypothetical protein
MISGQKKTSQNRPRTNSNSRVYTPTKNKGLLRGFVILTFFIKGGLQKGKP